MYKYYLTFRLYFIFLLNMGMLNLPGPFFFEFYYYYCTKGL